MTRNYFHFVVWYWLVGHILGCDWFSINYGKEGGPCADNGECRKELVCNRETWRCEKKTCIPDCSGKICGDDDGCGGRCTDCPGSMTCNQTTWQCENTCTPNCTEKTCGQNDDCGGKCTACPSGQTCNITSWICESCAPDCTGKSCGDSDGCGGRCRTCPDQEICDTTNWRCCAPLCTGKCGGPDGCGGTCPNTCEEVKNCLAPDYVSCGQCTNHSECDDENFCTTDLCQGGVCKNEPANKGVRCSQCRLCQEGQCEAVPAGQDPFEDCQNEGCSNSGFCDGSGACQVPLENTDPNDFCPDGPCLTGFCDGNGLCGRQENGTVCDDGNPATNDDHCQDGVCQGSCTPSWTAAVVKAGGYHTCAITASGGVKCWGQNVWGAVGDNTYDNFRVNPVNVSGLGTNVLDLALGDFHTCALLSSWGVKCWGRNMQGQLGDGNEGNFKTTPTDVSGLSSGTIAITAGAEHTCALFSDGVKCWGNNLYGQVGNGLYNYNVLLPAAVLTLTSGVGMVVAGGWHTCALMTAGSVKCWGLNNTGQLGIDTATTFATEPQPVTDLGGVEAITAGQWHSCALLSSGQVKCWGDDSFGQLGNGSGGSSWRPVEVVNLIDVKAIAAGFEHTCALLTSGEVRCWGRNDLGQLGDGSATSRPDPVAVTGLSSAVSAITAGGHHSCALLTSGGIQCWGYDETGQLGDGRSGTYSLRPVLVNGTCP